jgi:hypothetical protein
MNPATAVFIIVGGGFLVTFLYAVLGLFGGRAA